MITLTLEIGSTAHKAPVGTIKINGQTVHEGRFEQEYKIKPRIGENTLCISLENKKDRDTKLVGNQIVEDVYVKVVDIQCDITKDSAGNFDTIGSYRTQKGEDLKTYGYLSYNGEYTFHFQYPFFIFQKNKIFYQ